MTTHQNVPFDFRRVRDAIVRVGDGRGCLLAASYDERIVLTAAHSLPHLPPAHAGSGADERTYFALLGPIGGDASIAAECRYADPVADLAVLGVPDQQEAPLLADAFETFTKGRPALRLTGLRRRSPAWVLSLDGAWQRCTAEVQDRHGRALTLIDAEIVGGMSGSPALDSRGRVIGTVGPGPDAASRGPAVIQRRAIGGCSTSDRGWLRCNRRPPP